MKVENPAALRFILEDELYLLNADKALYEKAVEPVPAETPVAPPQNISTPPAVTTAVIPEPVTAEAAPVVNIPTPSITIPSIAPEPTAEIKTQDTGFKYMGKNLQHFLVFTHYTDAEFIRPEHWAALENILKRKGYSPDDVAILNTATYSATKFSEFKVFFKPVKVLLLGAEALPPDLKVLKPNKPVTSNGITALYSYSFNDMMDNVEYKKIFWEQVKTL
ncbi:hypothetical protein LX99_04504 [Mucilaginibacter oryzae]|uniref:Uncharacterized protein n=1 Tax=Mucilaginibacter oryzae TaxID=468058 RepID=A0A316H051_9SPHI|nr:hypothetical protein [Mucilaginibacter oryzae]PWK71480.1 hypothetical protein LX99_04504 [Mucilaginibacter oryzae]